MHVEKSPRVRNHLRVLELKNVQLEIIERQPDYVVGKYPNNFYRLLRQTAKVTTTKCKEPRILVVRTVQSDDLSEALHDPYWEPSFDWAETIGDEAGKGYYVYKKPDWKVEEIRVDYMRKPKEMAAFNLSGCSSEKPYITSDGRIIKSDRHCEFSDTYLWRGIADLAALFAMRDLGQVDDAKTKMEEMIFSEIMKV